MKDLSKRIRRSKGRAPRWEYQTSELAYFVSDGRVRGFVCRNISVALPRRWQAQSSGPRREHLGLYARRWQAKRVVERAYASMNMASGGSSAEIGG
jgi:hypothetical protein